MRFNTLNQISFQLGEATKKIKSNSDLISHTLFKIYDTYQVTTHLHSDLARFVNAAIPPGATGNDAVLARRKIFAEIEKESLAKTGLRSDVVTLYQGGAYHLYRFKKYTDIRLVFAPEPGVAFF